MSSTPVAEQNRPLGMGNHMSLAFKQAIINLRDYFRSKNKEWSVRQLMREISEALKISEGTVCKVLCEKKNNKTVSEPKKRRRIHNGYQFNSVDKEVVQTVINDIYQPKELPSIKRVFIALKDQKYEHLTQNLSFKSCSLRTFYTIYHKMGFKYNPNAFNKRIKRNGTTKINSDKQSHL